MEETSRHQSTGTLPQFNSSISQKFNRQSSRRIRCGGSGFGTYHRIGRLDMFFYPRTSDTRSYRNNTKVGDRFRSLQLDTRQGHTADCFCAIRFGFRHLRQY